MRLLDACFCFLDLILIQRRFLLDGKIQSFAIFCVWTLSPQNTQSTGQTKRSNFNWFFEVKFKTLEQRKSEEFWKIFERVDLLFHSPLMEKLTFTFHPRQNWKLLYLKLIADAEIRRELIDNCYKMIIHFSMALFTQQSTLLPGYLPTKKTIFTLSFKSLVSSAVNTFSPLIFILVFAFLWRYRFSGGIFFLGPPADISNLPRDRLPAKNQQQESSEKPLMILNYGRRITANK